jgi:hypothetical protein
LLLGLFPRNQNLLVEGLDDKYQLPPGYENNHFLSRKIEELRKKPIPHFY